MGRQGFTLVEILVGLVLLGLALGGGLALLRGASTKAGAEGAALLAGEKARQAVEGLSKELSGMQAALLLHGDSTSVALVATFPPGLPVLRQGYKPGEALIETNTPPDLQKGALFQAPTGEAFYAPTATLKKVPGNTYRVLLPSGCPNSLPFTEGLRLFRALLLELSFKEGILSLSAPGIQEKVALKDFQFRYVYVNRAGREVAQTDYRGASYQEGGEDFYLSYLGLYAQAKSGAISRDAALRIPLAKEVTKVLTCGSQSPAAGTGAVTIIVNKIPSASANVADITLTAQGGYVRQTNATTTYTDVPSGPFTVLAKQTSLGPGGMAIWRPEGNPTHEYKDTASTFVPKKVTVNYKLAQGTIRIESVTLQDGTVPEDFQGRLVWRGEPWSPAYSFTFNSKSRSYPVNPGFYTFDPIGWELVSSTPPLPIRVASDQTVSLRLVVKPGPLLLRLIVPKPARNNGLNPLICIWPDSGKGLIPPDAEVNACPTDSR